MIEALFGGTTRVLEQSIQLRMMRQGLLAANIANAETPNYRAVDIDFQATMANAIAAARQQEEQPEPLLELARTDPRHFSLDLPEPAAEESPDGGIVFAAGDAPAIGSDNNTVSLEQQMGRMQMNTTIYTLLTKLYAGKMNHIKNVIESTSRS